MNTDELTDTFMNHVDLMMTFFIAYLSAASAYLAGGRIAALLGQAIPANYSLALRPVAVEFSFTRRKVLVRPCR